MDEKRVLDQARQYLTQIALELEEAAAAARAGANSLPDRKAGWIQAQQMYARLDEAKHLIRQLQRAVGDATAQTGEGAPD